jgi:hypothetical protein
VAPPCPAFFHSDRLLWTFCLGWPGT